MADDGQLKIGMSVTEVAGVLRGWKFEPAVVPEHDSARMHSWDALRPDGKRRVRLTFVGASLVRWGEA